MKPDRFEHFSELVGTKTEKKNTKLCQAIAVNF